MVIVGLGNPGSKYEQTRHNVGFMFVDKLAESYNTSFVLDKQKEALIADIYIDGKKHLLVKPVTYMNNSGNAVIKVLNYWNIDPSELIVVYDDMDLEVGKIYTGTVVRIMNFGAFVEVVPGKEGMIHISKLAKERVEKVEDVVSLGDEIIVKALGADKKGRQNFSRKDAIPTPKPKAKKEKVEKVEETVEVTE